MTIIIVPERPDTNDARMLIAELESHLAPHYRQDEVPVGCGGVQFFGAEYGEIKRMFVRPQFRGSGLARLMLNHRESYTSEHSIHILRLETGIHQTDAIRLYEKMGYRNIPPFGEYVDDPLSRFYEKRLLP